MAMSLKPYAVACICIVALFLLLITMFRDSVGSDRLLRSYTDPRTQELERVTRTLIQQRNNISRQLNLKQQKVGQMQCEKQGDQGEATSETGGWCMKSSKENTGNHMTDNNLAAALIQFFEGKYVGSFGDGPGRYKQIMTDSGKLKMYDAYDGAPYCETTSEGRVKFLDLTLPQYGLPLYDWIISLEVAEHIPQQFESIFIDNIVRHAKEGVVLSWARPGQGGYSHVNNRPFEYVKEILDRQGFYHDDVESQKLKEAAVFDWFRHNTNVFRRKEPLNDPLETYN